jgi:hypothetical protein
MRMVRAEGGYSFAVYGNEHKQKVARQLLDEERVNFACPADYSVDGELMNIVKHILDKIKTDYSLSLLETKN